jgi:hypothetical protein
MPSSFIGDASSPAQHDAPSATAPARRSEAVAVLGGGVVGNGFASRVVVGNGFASRVGLPYAGGSNDDDVCGRCTGRVVLGMFQSALPGR